MASTIEATTAGTVVKNTPTARQFRNVFDYVIEATVTLTEASIAAGVVSQVAVTIPGAKLGDKVEITKNAAAAGSFVFAEVTATDTVTISILNLETVDANTAWSAGVAVNVWVLGKRPAFATK